MQQGHDEQEMQDTIPLGLNIAAVMCRRAGWIPQGAQLRRSLAYFFFGTTSRTIGTMRVVATLDTGCLCPRPLRCARYVPDRGS
jgi:hypothetical protein